MHCSYNRPVALLSCDSTTLTFHERFWSDLQKKIFLNSKKGQMRV